MANPTGDPYANSDVFIGDYGMEVAYVKHGDEFVAMFDSTYYLSADEVVRLAEWLLKRFRKEEG